MATLACGYLVDGSQALFGKGRMYFDRFDSSGNSTAYRFLGAGELFEPHVTPTLVELYDPTAPGGALIGSVESKRLIEASVELLQYHPEDVALALMGDVSALTQSASSVSGGSETLTTAATVDRLYKTAFRNISALTLKYGSTYGSATSMATPADYIVADAKSGLIYIPVGSAATGAKVFIDYTYAALALSQISIGTAGTILGKLTFIPNNAQGPALEAELWRCQISPDGPTSFIGEQFGKIKLKMRILNDAANHATQPYGVIRQAA